MNHTFFNKALAGALCLGILAPSFALAAQDTTVINANVDSQTGTFNNVQVQNAPYNAQTTYRAPSGGAGSGGSGYSAGSGAASGIASITSCLAGGLLGGAVSLLKNKALSVANKALSVPTSNTPLENSSADTAGNTGTEVNKNCVLDAIAVSIRQALIAEMTQSIVDWINGGFEGEPAFVSNLGDFFTNIADETAYNFIMGSGLSSICSPFQVDIRLALAQNYANRYSHNFACNFGVGVNIGGFYSGTSPFSWDQWWQSTELQNNPIDAAQLAQAELEQQLAEGKSEAQLKYTAGQGYTGTDKCDQYDSTTGKCTHYTTVTAPVNVAQGAVQAQGTGLRQLEMADAFDEIVNALLGQLLQKALTGVGGFYGLSARGSGSSNYFSNVNNYYSSGPGQSYLDQVVAQTGTDASNAQTTGLLNNIQGSIGIEQSAQSTLSQGLNDIENTTNAYAQVYDCYIGLTKRTSNFITTSEALTRANSASSTIATEITPQVATRSSQFSNTQNVIYYLQGLYVAASSATTPEEISTISNSYDSTIASGAVYTPGGLTILASDVANSKSGLDALTTQAQQQLNQCRSL